MEIKNKKRKPTMVYMSEAVARESKIAAIQLKMSRSEYIETAILDRLEKDFIKIQQIKN